MGNAFISEVAYRLWSELEEAIRTMAAAGSANAGTIFQRLGLKPITKYSLLNFYVPAAGVASYTALSINVMNPSLVIR